MAKKSVQNVIVRSRDAGVFAGTLISRPSETSVILKDARRLWYWDGAATLSELATKGTSNPGACKFPAPVTSIEILGICEIIPLTDDAKKSIDAVAVWSRH